MTTHDAEDMTSDHNAELVNLLDLAMKPAPDEESAVNDFAVELLKQLGYVKRHRVARTRNGIPFYICGEWKHAKTDVCLIDRMQNDILLLIQEDKRFSPEDPRDPAPQLIAEAIATFDCNNRLRVSAGETALESKVRHSMNIGDALCSLFIQVMPGIVLTGTAPTFYKIPVSSNLVRDVHHGTYPLVPTVVSAHGPTLPRPRRGHSEDMKPLDNRQALLRCFEAFKRVVGI